MMPERGLGWSAVGRSAEIQATTPNLALYARFLRLLSLSHILAAGLLRVSGKLTVLHAWTRSFA